MSAQYPVDEFDEVEDGAPEGVHRQPRSPWQTVLPFLLALILVPLLAWGTTALIKGRGTDVHVPPSASQSQQSTQQSNKSRTPVKPQSNQGPTGAPDNPSETKPNTKPENPTEAPAQTDVNMAASITVFNVSGIEGLAGSNVERLATAGFTGATAENLESTGQTENTVFYRDASLATTAAKVGETLGIGHVVELADATGDKDIAVVLLSQN